MSTPNTDPLLTPTLTEEDDTAGFDRPWNPWTLVMFTFFFGLIGGGGLLAFNYRKLGMRGWMDTALVGTILAGVLVSLGITWVITSDLVAGWDPGVRTVVRAAARGLGTLVATMLAATQQKRWRLFRATGLPPGKLLGPGIQAAAGSIVLQVLITQAALQMFGPIPIAPPTAAEPGGR